jgi:hypothetical protein
MMNCTLLGQAFITNFPAVLPPWEKSSGLEGIGGKSPRKDQTSAESPIAKRAIPPSFDGSGKTDDLFTLVVDRWGIRVS